MDKFIDRFDAGSTLAKELKGYADKPNTLILALPRGGVPVAYQVAKALSLPLDVFIVRKLGVPGHKELALGAIASGGAIIYNDEIIKLLALSDSVIQSILETEQKELERRELLYRKDLPPLKLRDKHIILVDDGIATGATIHAAVKSIAKQKPAQITIAVPVAASDTCKELERFVDKLISLLKPVNFYAVGLWYDDFTQTTDEEVADLLLKAQQNLATH